MIELKIRYLILVALALIGYAFPSFGQNVDVRQKIAPEKILIGEQAILSLQVNAPTGTKIEFPNYEYAQQLVAGVEVVDIKQDTLKSSKDSLCVRRNYTLTSFDEKLYSLPALKVKVNGKVYDGNILALKVLTVEVDTLHPNQFYGPKDVQSNPFDWKEWQPMFWLSLLVFILCLVVAWLTLRLKQNRPIISRIRFVKKLLPHQKALKEIEEIKAERLTISDNQKEYYSKLTDTLRQYIQERFGFNAKEMTSSQIIENLRKHSDEKMMNELTSLFRTADLVKFAKYSTLINENDLNLMNAISFIDQTKQEGQETVERVEPKLSEDEKRSQQTRKTIKILLWLSVVALVALIIIIGFMLYGVSE